MPSNIPTLSLLKNAGTRAGHLLLKKVRDPQDRFEQEFRAAKKDSKPKAETESKSPREETISQQLKRV